MSKKSKLRIELESLCEEIYPRKHASTKKKLTDKLIGRINRWHSKYGVDKDKLLDDILNLFYNSEKCIYCNNPLTYENLSMDRIISEHQGGQNVDENLQYICKSCNRKKGILNGDSYEKLLHFIKTNLKEEEQKYVLRKLAMWVR